jgi:hypothetical protein
MDERTLQEQVEELADQDGQQNILHALWARANAKAERAVLPENAEYWRRTATVLGEAFLKLSEFPSHLPQRAANGTKETDK